jgi:hypothetical protein
VADFSAEQCRHAARACLEVAKSVYDLNHRAMVLELADDWLVKAGTSVVPPPRPARLRH